MSVTRIEQSDEYFRVVAIISSRNTITGYAVQRRIKWFGLWWGEWKMCDATGDSIGVLNPLRPRMYMCEKQAFDVMDEFVIRHGKARVLQCPLESDGG